MKKNIRRWFLWALIFASTKILKIWFPLRLYFSIHYLPRLRCHPEVTSDQTVPDESKRWSDHPRRSWPLIRLMCAQNTVCAECALKMVPDHTIPIRNWSLIRPKSDHCQTIVQPWPRRNADHCPDDCARHWSILLLKIFWPPPDHCPDNCATMAQAIVRFRWPLIRLFPSGTKTQTLLLWSGNTPCALDFGWSEVTSEWHLNLGCNLAFSNYNCESAFECFKELKNVWIQNISAVE